MHQPRESDADMERLRERLADEVERRRIAETRSRSYESQVHQLRSKLVALSRLKPDPTPEPSADGATRPRRRNHW